MTTDSKKRIQWGGSRNGSGRKPNEIKKRKISVSLDCALLEKMRALPENRSAIIETAVRFYLSERLERVSEKSVVYLENSPREDAMIDLIIQMEPRARLSAPVGIPELWRKAESSGWNRRDFEDVLFGLAKDYQIFFHRHAHELQATEVLKTAALRGKDGSLYIGLVLKSTPATMADSGICQ